MRPYVADLSRIATCLTSAHPNAVSTMDYPRGNLAFRWFLADRVPEPPVVELVKLAEAPTTPA